MSQMDESTKDNLSQSSEEEEMIKDKIDPSDDINSGDESEGNEGIESIQKKEDVATQEKDDESDEGEYEDEMKVSDDDAQTKARDDTQTKAGDRNIRDTILGKMDFDPYGVKSKHTEMRVDLTHTRFIPVTLETNNIEFIQDDGVEVVEVDMTMMDARMDCARSCFSKTPGILTEKSLLEKAKSLLLTVHSIELVNTWNNSIFNIAVHGSHIYRSCASIDGVECSIALRRTHTVDELPPTYLFLRSGQKPEVVKQLMDVGEEWIHKTIVDITSSVYKVKREFVEMVIRLGVEPGELKTSLQETLRGQDQEIMLKKDQFNQMAKNLLEYKHSIHDTFKYGEKMSFRFKTSKNRGSDDTINMKELERGDGLDHADDISKWEAGFMLMIMESYSDPNPNK